ncbi:MAG: hypothetical protein PHZ26_00055 [Candidatus Gracilibacteria bacterium]|nr:hypothetical protein [Candidatus Gracilibacteria bacterium]MDD2908129.1 hypothetical protein [Candidatus Gracilibacteria bacterium]
MSSEKQGNYITDSNENGLLLDEMLSNYSNNKYITQEEINNLKTQYEKEKMFLGEEISIEVNTMLLKLQSDLDKVQLEGNITQK